jgi:hypothetical protein
MTTLSTFTATINGTGGPLGIRAVFTPSVSLRHADTKAVLGSTTVSVTDYKQLVAALPRTGQAGLIDSAGKAVKDWYWIAEVSEWHGGGRSISYRKTFSKSTAGTLNLDTVKVAEDTSAVAGYDTDTASGRSALARSRELVSVLGEPGIDVSRAFNGKVLRTDGPSWIQYGSYDTQPFPTLLIDALGFDSIDNQGAAGHHDQDISQLMVAGGTSRTFNTAFAGPALVHGGNNLINADTQVNRRAALEAARTMAALLSASERIESTSGGWVFKANGTGENWMAESAQPYASGGSARIGTYGGLQIDIPVPAGTSYLLCHGTDGADGRRGMTIRVSQNGTEVASKSMDAVTIPTQYVSANGTAPVVIRLANLQAGIITVTTDRTGITGDAYAIVDALLPQSKTPRLIFAVKPVSLKAPTHEKPALWNYLRTVYDTVRAEIGSHYLVVDPQPDWMPDLMLGADGLHPTLAGTAEHADAIVAAFKSRVWQQMVRSAT